MKRVAIVGASLAGLRAAEALRAQGFDGEIVVFGAEPHRPYDRTTLTKGYLEGALDDADIELAEEADLAALDLDLRLGEPVLGLRPADRAVILGSDRIHRSDAVIIATGARARAIPVAGRLPSSAVHAVRDLGDARRLRRELAQRPSRVVVVGSGFLGSEVASVARRVGIETTVVEAAARPLAERFPEVVGERIQALHAAHGVDLRCGVALTGLRGAGRVEAVELSDGSILAADVVVVAVGSLPNTEWLAGSGLAVDGGVGCDLAGATAIENVVVTGDAARVHDPTSGGSTRHEHWHFAQSHPAIAVEYLLHRRRPPALEPLYVWSDQHGHRIQLVGNWRLPAGAVTSTDEDADGLTIAVRHRGRLVAALVIDRPREFARLRRELRGVAGPNVEAAAR